MLISDMKSLMQLKNAENWNQTEEDWMFLVKSSPEFCLVAISEDKIIGTVTAINYQNKLAWIGMMLVSKEYRGLGVSKILMNTIINKLKGFESLKLDATLAGIPVYRKLGFEEEYQIVRMVHTDIGNMKDYQKNMNITKISKTLERDISIIIKKDQTLFGIKRDKLIRFLLKNKKDISLQVLENNELKGYVFGRNGSNYVQLGPLLAYSTESAKGLITDVFCTLKGYPIVLDVLLNKTELINWLLSVGFRQQRNFTRMYLKSNNFAGEMNNQYLTGGPELG